VDGKLGGREGTAEKIRTAIEIAGVEFIEENGSGGPGVRLKKRPRPEICVRLGYGHPSGCPFRNDRWARSDLPTELN